MTTSDRAVPVRFLIVLLLLTTLAAGRALAADLPAFSRLDVFELEWVSRPQLSPDGRRLVYVRNGMDIMRDKSQGRLWLINSDGSGHMKLTARDDNESNPAWSPDGSRIAFTSSTENGAEIFVYWVDSGKISRLTQLDRGPQGLSWSPDGSQLAFSMLVPEAPVVLVKAPARPKDAEWAESPRVTTRLKHERDGSGYIEPGFSHYFVIPAEGGTPRQVTSGRFLHSQKPVWSQDGRSLIFSANRNADWETDYVNSDIYRTSLTDGETVALTHRKGPDAEPVVSPDGQQIAFVGYEDKVQTYQVTSLYVMQADGSGNRVLTADLDRSVSAPVWDRRGKGLYFQYDDKGNTRIGYVTLSGKVSTVAENLGGTTIGRPYGGGSFSVSDAGNLAYTYTTPSHPAELALLRRPGAKPELITDLNGDVLPHRTLGQVEEIWYRSSIDQRDIQGWIVKPPGFDASKRYPLLVENHGGPISNYGDRFSPEMQLYAAAGYVVFYPNPRGSTSYGEEFGNLLYHNYPGDDYQDVMDGVDAMLKTGYVSEDELFVTGGSAGGIMTAWIIGKNNRFRAAVVVKPIMNWISKTLTADNYFQYANYRFPKQPWENIETYMKFSPISLVGNVETPTMVMVGTADLRTPIGEAKQLYHALKLRAIDTALVEIPDAFHLIARRPSQLIAKIDHTLAWFDKYRSERVTIGQD